MSINMDDLGSAPSVDLLKSDYVLNKVQKTETVAKEPVKEEIKANEKTAKNTESLELSSKYSSVAEKQINLESYQNEFNTKAVDYQKLSTVEESLSTVNKAVFDKTLSEEDFEKIKNEELSNVDKLTSELKAVETKDFKLDTSIQSRSDFSAEIDKAIQDINTKKQQLEADMDSLISNGIHLIRLKLENNASNSSAETQQPAIEQEATPLEQKPDAEKVNKDIIKDPVKSVDIQINNLDGNLLLALLSVTKSR